MNCVKFDVNLIVVTDFDMNKRFVIVGVALGIIVVFAVIIAHLQLVGLMQCASCKIFCGPFQKFLVNSQYLCLITMQ